MLLRLLSGARVGRPHVVAPERLVLLLFLRLFLFILSCSYRRIPILRVLRSRVPLVSLVVERSRFACHYPCLLVDTRSVAWRMLQFYRFHCVI